MKLESIYEILSTIPTKMLKTSLLLPNIYVNI